VSGLRNTPAKQPHTPYRQPHLYHSPTKPDSNHIQHTSNHHPKPSLHGGIRPNPQQLYAQTLTSSTQAIT
jgi:hypothetical protein